MKWTPKKVKQEDADLVEKAIFAACGHELKTDEIAATTGLNKTRENAYIRDCYAWLQYSRAPVAVTTHGARAASAASHFDHQIRQLYSRAGKIMARAEYLTWLALDLFPGDEGEGQGDLFQEDD